MTDREDPYPGQDATTEAIGLGDAIKLGPLTRARLAKELKHASVPPIGWPRALWRDLKMGRAEVIPLALWRSAAQERPELGRSLGRV